jgi:hypothetical protein
VHVDWSVVDHNDAAYKYGGSFYGDCWNVLFEPTIAPDPPFDSIWEYPFYEITAGCAGVLYQNEQWNWRQRYNNEWKKLTCKVQGLPVEPNTVGVLIRSEALGGEQLSGRSPTLEQYAASIDKNANLFVVSSDQESLSWFCNQYPNTKFTEGIKRNAKRSDREQHIHIPQTKEDAVQVMQEVLTLANCQTLVHPVSNMATAALYMNLNLKSIFVKS